MAATAAAGTELERARTHQLFVVKRSWHPGAQVWSGENQAGSQENSGKPRHEGPGAQSASSCRRPRQGPLQGWPQRRRADGVLVSAVRVCALTFLT